MLTSLFLIVVYRLMGTLAVLALGCYELISYAALAALGATLTLPGLAGFVLAIGMAVDANVLVFERAREEYAARRRTSLRSALTAGFRNAFSAIADSNITTLIAAGLLFFLASGPVRGFGVTLGIGVLASMLSALVVTRVLADFAVARGPVRRRPRLTGIAGTGRVRDRLSRRAPAPDAHRRAGSPFPPQPSSWPPQASRSGGWTSAWSSPAAGSSSTPPRPPVSPTVPATPWPTPAFPRAVVQASGDNALTVRTDRLSNAQEARITGTVGDLAGTAEKVRDELIGPSLGEELRRGAVIALAAALAAQLLYLAVRFRWTFGTAAVAAMAHDALILTGVFAWLGKPIDGVFLAALLTVIGYSVNDSVVVFDRIRELWARDHKSPFAKVTNTALLQTVPRTINTGMGAVFILSALALLGGDSLTDFALALLIGIVVGTYSSMFTAAPLAVGLHARGTRPPGNP